jgi:hypothetical protein
MLPMKDRGHVAKRFVVITNGLVGVSVIACLLIILDPLLGLSLGFASKDIPVGIFVVGVSLFIRIFGGWMMRVTGDLD